MKTITEHQQSLCMADQEIIKHTKKIYKVWNSPEHSFVYKLKEFGIEIFIIVFAVTLSIQLHNFSEHSHQQKEVKEFLLGIKDDLSNDIAEMEKDRHSYIEQGLAFKYVTSVKKGQGLNSDSINKYKKWFYNTTRLVQNSGRFEGFKSSGKIGNIEDHEIQNNLMDLYQENVPVLLSSTDYYLQSKRNLLEFFEENRKIITDSTSNLAMILGYEKAYNICYSLAFTNEIIARYTNCIEKAKTIISKIKSTYEN